MTQTQYHILIIATALLFVFMIVMNVLANLLPINGETTGGVSFMYPNLFQPSGSTFSIWGILYLFLGGIVIYFFTKWNTPINELSSNVSLLLYLFGLSSLLNVVWLLLWHHHQIVLSTIVIIFLLLTLLLVSHYAKDAHWLLRTGFSMYAGWITIATIANITIALVSKGVPSFDQRAIILTIVILVIGAIIGILYTLLQKDFVFGLVFIWAYVGLLMRHINLEGLSRSYVGIIITSSISIFFLISSVIIVLLQLKK